MPGLLDALGFNCDPSNPQMGLLARLLSPAGLAGGSMGAPAGGFTPGPATPGTPAAAAGDNGFSAAPKGLLSGAGPDMTFGAAQTALTDPSGLGTLSGNMVANAFNQPPPPPKPDPSAMAPPPAPTVAPDGTPILPGGAANPGNRANSYTSPDLPTMAMPGMQPHFPTQGDNAPVADMPAAGASPTSGQGAPGSAASPVDWSGYTDDGVNMSGVPATVAANLKRFADDNPAKVTVSKAGTGGVTLDYDTPAGQTWAATNAAKYGLTLDPKDPTQVTFAGATPTGPQPADIRPQPQGGPAVPAAPAAPLTLASAQQLLQQGQQPDQSGVMGTIANAIGGLYGRGGPGDALINLGVGMSSGPGGVQRALASTAQQQQNAQANQVQQAQLQMQIAKLAQSQQGQQALIPVVKAKMAAANGGAEPSDAAVMAVISNPSALSSIASQLIKTPDQEKADKAQLVTVKNPDGTETQQWMTPGSATGTPIGPASAPKPPDAVRDLQYAQQNWKQLGLPDPSAPENASYWQNFSQQRLAGGGTTVNVGGDANTYDKQLAEGLGKAHAALSNGVEGAQSRLQDLNAMQGALARIQANGGTTGFGQTQLTQMKSAINSGASALGIDQPFDISDPEFLTKFNRQIAGAQAKAVGGARVTNFEMQNYLKANPGLEMSPTGNQRLLGIQSQIEQRNVDLGQAIRNATAQAIAGGRKIDPTTVQGIITSYDAAHHVTDPVTGQDLTQRVALPEFQGGAGSAGTTTSPAWSFTPGG